MGDRQSKITVVVGAQWGDEGKGKITDFFAGEVDYIVRFQGGNNAGHTVNVKGVEYKLHLIPSGVLYDHPTSVIANGVVVNPQALIEELHRLKKSGLEPRLAISARAHVIMPYHMAMDEALTGHQGALAAGSTKRGIAPVYADKMYRHGIRLMDLTEPAVFREKLTKAYQFNTRILTQVFDFPWDISLEAIYEEYCQYGRELRSYITDTSLLLSRAYREGKNFLFEGAQGVSLDIDHGIYPHTTSSNTLAGHVSVGCGVGFRTLDRVIGVAKAYVSRVGISPFPTELEEAQANLLRERGQEYGTTTGRPRRVGWLDLVQLRQAVRCNGLTELALTKLDILTGFAELPVCVAYDIDGERVTEMPASLTAYRAAKPIYHTLPGWQELNSDNPNFDSLPPELHHFLAFIEKAVECPIKIISVGPQRHQTILLEP